MKVLNYRDVAKGMSKRLITKDYKNIHVHKINEKIDSPKVSIILLDWECRERFHSLDWLSKQTIPRKYYELIWVELYNRVIPEVLEKTDVLITCGQKGLYHKHIGYNFGLLHAQGEVITICDSDAVFPPDFVFSIMKSFNMKSTDESSPTVLMHYELRTSFTYSEDLKDLKELKDKKWEWWPLHPNVGACMSVRKVDAIRFGGFDEHKSYRGYLCGPYDLAWRLINAGIPEIWHDTSTVIWHFAHPDPAGVNGIRPTVKMLLEYTWPHVDLHAITAVQAFSTGRLLPLMENPKIFKLRMEERKIGTTFEEKYASMTGPNGFSRWQLIRLRFSLMFDILRTAILGGTYRFLLVLLRKCVGPWVYEKLRKFRQSLKGSEKHKDRIYAKPQGLGPLGLNDQEIISLPDIGSAQKQGEGAGPINNAVSSKYVPELVGSYKGYHLVKHGDLIYAIPQVLGSVDLNDKEQISLPEILSAQKQDETVKLVDLYTRWSTDKTRNEKRHVNWPCLGYD